MRLTLACFLRDRRGAALVEFAFALPFMLLLFFGTAEVVQAVQAQQKLAHIASAIGDVVARERTISAAEMADILAAGPVMMTPFPTASLGERVLSFSADAAGAVALDWQADGPPYAGNAPAVLPDGFLKPGESVIVTDVSYAYKPLMSLVFPGPLSFQKRTYLRPRLTDKVGRS